MYARDSMKKIFLLFFFTFLCLFLSFHLKPVSAIDQGMPVRATVPPNPSDFQFQFNTDGKSTVAQDDLLTYTITFGAKATAGLATTNTILVQLGNEKAPDGSYIVDYVINSASTAYGGVQPVVDTIHRTITWTIPNLPEGTTDQHVTFQLRPTGSYDIQQSLSFTTSSQMTNDYVSLPPQSVSQSYLFDPSHVKVNPTPTGKAVPATTPSPTVTPTPPASIVGVSVAGLTDSDALIEAKTSTPARVQANYGISPTDLNQTVQTNTYAYDSIVQLTNLKPSTTYYIQLTIIAANGQRDTSEIFTFTTAQASQSQSMSNSSITITSGGALILSDVLTSRATSLGILTSHTGYTVTYTFAQPMQVTALEAIIKNPNGSDHIVTLSATSPQVYTASLQSGDPGSYTISIRLRDPEGNITEQNAARLKVIAPLRVLEQDSNTPISDARVYLWQFNQATQTYEPVTNLRNPGATDDAGIDSFILPRGKYRVAVTALWHDGQTIDFTLGGNAGEDYPTIYLKNNPFNIISLLEHVKNVVIDTMRSILTSLKETIRSVHVFNRIATAAVGSSVLISSLFFGFRTDIRWKSLFPFALFGLYVTFRKHKEAYIYGTIVDKEGRPASRVRIEIIDLKSNTVLSHTITNRSGRFAIRNTFKQGFIKLVAAKDGSAASEQIIETDTHKPLEIKLGTHSAAPAVVRSVRHLFGELFELAILLSLIFELAFLFTFGINRTLPFFIISACNLLLWIFFQREKKL